MFQQTTVQDHANKTTFKANGRYAQSIVGILQVVWGNVRKSAAILLHGFHTVVASAEQPHTTKSDYWWNSRETVDDLLSRNNLV